jgi:hypothetical protein
MKYATVLQYATGVPNVEKTKFPSNKTRLGKELAYCRPGNGSNLRVAAAAPSPCSPQLPLPPKLPTFLCMSSTTQKPGRDLRLCCSLSGVSPSVVTKDKEQDEAVTAPLEEGYEPAVLSYKDDPNFW